MKKPADTDTFGAEVAAPEYLNRMPEPIAPRLLGADSDAGILLMEDLGPGASLAGSLLAGDRSRVRADLCPSRGTGIGACVEHARYRRPQVSSGGTG